MMGISWTACMAMLALVISQITIEAQFPSGSCSSACGFLATCENSTCSCPQEFVIHENGKDCRNASCTNTDCLQCESPVKCIRCESFISLSTGFCLKKCEGSAEVINDSFICTEAEKDDDDGVSIVIAVVSGVAAGTVLCIIVIAGACFYIRRTRRNINLQNKDYNNRHLESGHVKQFPAYENNAYDTDNPTIPTSAKIDPTVYANELDKLRPHAETLVALLSQVRSKTRAMDASDERVPTYKGVIHQLCRVLVLVHRRDPVASIPSDALGLIQWAHQMLEDHREQQQSTGEDSVDFPIAQISATDLDFDNPANPVYATPERNHLPDPASAILQGVATPYSSVPIPVSESEQQLHHYGTGKKPGFATISRARAKPNSELIRALEAELNNTSTFSAPLVSEYETATQYQNNNFKREDLQNFIIHNGEKSDLKNFDHNVDNTLQTPEKHPISSEQNNVIHRNFSLELKEKLKNRINKAEHKNLFSISLQSCQPETVTVDHTIVSQQSAKKNIITNPNALKKTSSLPGKHPKYATPRIGYFANGQYYDPKPMPSTDAEVYAPGSSYSDQSNVMSTFLGDLPRSASSSEQSEDGDEDSETSGGDLDVFPFDPKDCTEPVEV